MKNKIPIEIIAPVSSLSNRTRLYKLASYILDQGKQSKIKHLSWVRVKNEADEKELPRDKIFKKVLINGGGYGSFSTKILYPLWMSSVFIYCLFRASKGPVWALGFESAFPAVLASKIRKFDVIFDDADRFSMVFPFPRTVKKLIQSLEKYTSSHCALHVIPGKDRYNFNSIKFHILHNMPSKSEIEKAKLLSKKREWPNAKIIINVNGWLGKDRGMDAALAIANHFDKNDVALVVAGKVDCESAQKLIQCESVLYLGKISNAEALSTYLCSDYVLTYYDPKYEINTMAQSNKWGDALLLGTRVIVNAEVRTADFLREISGCISCPYHDHTRLLTIISKAVKAKNEIVSIPKQQYKVFEEQLDELFDRLNNNNR